MIVVKRDAGTLIKRIAVWAKQPELANIMFKPLNSGRVVSKLNVLRKSHKPAGKVTLRQVHSTPRYAFEGLSRWIASILGAKLKMLAPHVLRDCRDFCTRLDFQRPKSHEFVARMDIRDFFLSGTKEEIVFDIISVFAGEDPDLIQLIHDVLLLLLSHQYVRRYGGDQLYSVIVGTGMGLIHSAEVADLCYYVRVEKWAHRPGPYRSFTLNWYYRFRDDIIVCYNDREKFRKWMTHVRVVSRYFVAEVEAVTRGPFEFLEVHVNRSDSGAQYLYRHKFKSTSLGSLLDARSCHAQPVHRSWIATYISHIESLCVKPEHARASIDTVVQRFGANFTARLSSLAAIPRTPDPRRVVWFSIAFDPVVEAYMRRALKVHMRDRASLIKDAFGEAMIDRGAGVRLRLSAYNHYAPFHMRVRRIVYGWLDGEEVDYHRRHHLSS